MITAFESIEGSITRLLGGTYMVCMKRWDIDQKGGLHQHIEYTQCATLKDARATVKEICERRGMEYYYRRTTGGWDIVQVDPFVDMGGGLLCTQSGKLARSDS